tara:strand:+ start:148 stop:417 length:270 start_codon:yes stop_codon:yes gene_type:complete
MNQTWKFIKTCIIRFLAVIAFLYIFASAWYMINTRNIGTPFKDSLTPQQIQIKKESADIRGKIFYQGITWGAIVGILILIIYYFTTNPK